MEGSSWRVALHPCAAREPTDRGRTVVVMISRVPLARLALLLLALPSPQQQPHAQTIRTSLRPDMNTGPAAAQNIAGGGGGSSLEPSGFPGTAVRRRATALDMVANLSQPTLDGEWADVRRSLLSSCGLRDSVAAVGRGRTTHCFADFNHVDCCTMQADKQANENAGRVAGMHQQNQLGPGIQASSLDEHGGGGSWCTCHIGAGSSPPRDVCHVQFEAQIAFKLVWCPGRDDAYDRYTIVSDDGELLAQGRPGGDLPPKSERRQNFKVVEGSKYAQACVTDPARGI